MISMVKKYIVAFDAFGEKIQFNFNRQSEYKSVFGGIGSIILLAGFLMLLTTGLMDVINRKQFFVK